MSDVYYSAYVIQTIFQTKTGPGEKMQPQLPQRLRAWNRMAYSSNITLPGGMPTNAFCLFQLTPYNGTLPGAQLGTSKGRG